MHIREDLKLRRLYHQEIPEVLVLMKDVISRLPFQDQFAMDEENYFLEIINGKGEIYGAFNHEQLVAYSVLAFPGKSKSNLGIDLAIPDQDLAFVAVLDSTVVHESVRGQGLQRMFHEIREERAKESGCNYLYSTVHPENHASVKNLESAGFTLQFTRPMYGGKIRHCYAKRLK